MRACVCVCVCVYRQKSGSRGREAHSQQPAASISFSPPDIRSDRLQNQISTLLVSFKAPFPSFLTSFACFIPPFYLVSRDFATAAVFVLRAAPVLVAGVAHVSPWVPHHGAMCKQSYFLVFSSSLSQQLVEAPTLLYFSFFISVRCFFYHLLIASCFKKITLLLLSSLYRLYLPIILL